MNTDISTIYNDLAFLPESIRLQYTNFILRHSHKIKKPFLTYEDVLYRLRVGEPIEYVFNASEFRKLSLYVDKRCLIPRIETEELVEQVLGFLHDKQEVYTIIDIGTGSGAIILSIATETEQKHTYVGIDISSDALEVARINTEAIQLQNCVKLYISDFRNFDFTPFKNVVLCANLPYIGKSEYVQKSVMDYEPHLALFGGENGDELIQQLKSIALPLPNVKALFLEGSNGTLSSILK